MAKKISAIVSLAIIAAVIISAIVMYSIKIDHNINYNTPNEMWVIYNGKQQRLVDKEDEKKILDIMDDITSERYLTALFNKTTKLFNHIWNI